MFRRNGHFTFGLLIASAPDKHHHPHFDTFHQDTIAGWLQNYVIADVHHWGRKPISGQISCGCVYGPTTHHPAGNRPSGSVDNPLPFPRIFQLYIVPRRFDNGIILCHFYRFCLAGAFVHVRGSTVPVPAIRQWQQYRVRHSGLWPSKPSTAALNNITLGLLKS